MAKNVRTEDEDAYQTFIMQIWEEWGTTLRPAPKEFWHYTTASGLIEILKTGRVFATHVSCLNDSLEQKYFGDLVLTESEKQRAANIDTDLEILFEAASNGLRNRDFSAASNFVTCFSAATDDLGQWRGYGGGECGYAIGFLSMEILRAIQTEALMAPMEYDSKMHDRLVTKVVDGAKQFYLAGIKRGISDKAAWAEEFLAVFARKADLLGSIIKHPKFSGEMEHRVIRWFQDSDRPNLEFRQKRTLLARHLPLDFTVAKDGGRKLPISKIYVGPGPAKQVSKISVGDLLNKYGYGGIPVETSVVPYRLP